MDEDSGMLYRAFLLGLYAIGDYREPEWVVRNEPTVWAWLWVDEVARDSSNGDPDSIDYFHRR